MAAHIALLGTCDTKLNELLHLRKLIMDSAPDTTVTLIDVGRTPCRHEHITISQYLIAHLSSETPDLSQMPRGEVISHMAKCATVCLADFYSQGKVNGVIAAGGSGGTSLAAQAMRDALPIGFPKLIVSTVASGETGPIVGECDITLMYSVVDIAGGNELLDKVFGNAAGAIVGMAGAWERRRKETKFSGQLAKKRRVGITMFGVTTPAVDVARKVLEEQYDCSCYVFHATGHGGKAMERLVQQGDLDAVLDLTTTELCDYVAGGVMSAGPDRLSAALDAGLPCVISLGATDMVNFGPIGTVPEKYKDRKLYEHNPTVTLMRTNKDECRAIGKFLVEKCKKAKRKDSVKIVMPVAGVSIIATSGAPFEDREADDELMSVVEQGLKGSGIEVTRDERAVNDEGFASDIAKRLAELMGDHIKS